MSRSVLSPPAALSKWMARLQETIVGPPRRLELLKALGSRCRLVECPFLSRKQSGGLTWEQGARQQEPSPRWPEPPPAQPTPRAVSGAGRGLCSPLLPVFWAPPRASPFRKPEEGNGGGADHRDREQHEPGSEGTSLSSGPFSPGPAPAACGAGGPGIHPQAPFSPFAPLRSKGRGPASETA